MHSGASAANHSARHHFLKSIEAVFSASVSPTTTIPTILEEVTTLPAYALADAAASASAEDLMWSSVEYLALDDAETLSQQQHHVIYLCDYCKMVAIVLYSLLSVVAFLGNSLIFAAFLFIRRLRTPTNMLIANLAVADLMISVFCIPLSYWHVIIFEDQRWIFGAFLCKIFNYLQATAVFLSSWTLVAISFDRFMAIWFVMSPWLRINRRKAFYVIIATWAFSLTMALPLLIVNKVEVTRTGAGATRRLVQTCQEKWELVRGFLIFGDDEAPVVHAYTLLVFALQYCLPLLVLLVTYTFIGLRMWNSKVPGEPTPHFVSSQTSSTYGGILGASVTNTATNGIGSGGSAAINPQKSVHAQERRHESVKKLIPMVLLVSALYASCWLPQNVLMNIWISYDPSITSHPYILYIWWGSHTLAMFHSIVNPFIYYCQNKRIHEALNYLLGYLPCVRSSHAHTPLIAIHFNDDNTTTTALGVGVGAGAFASHKLSKSDAEGVRIVNMVAYMPVTGGKRVQPHSNDDDNIALHNNDDHNKNNKVNSFIIADTSRLNHCSSGAEHEDGNRVSKLPFSSNGRNNIYTNSVCSYAGGRRPTDTRHRDVW